MTSTKDLSPDGIDELGPSLDGDLSAAHDGQGSLGVFATMLDREEQGSVQTGDAGQLLRVETIVLGVGAGDEAHLAGVGHDDLVATLGEQPREPRGLSTHLEGDDCPRQLVGPAPEGGLLGGQSLGEDDGSAVV